MSSSGEEEDEKTEEEVDGERAGSEEAVGVPSEPLMVVRVFEREAVRAEELDQHGRRVIERGRRRTLHPGDGWWEIQKVVGSESS